jgi:predicted SAM-dependent methyltransferase
MMPMNLTEILKRKLPPGLKRRFNAIRYSTVPTWKMRLARLMHYPKLPTNADGKILIHLGCGDQNDPRYINVDFIPFRHVHYVHGVTRLMMFKDGFADLVYASHVLEHISYHHSVETLQEWGRLLKPGGVLRISVPDLDKILDIYKTEKHAIPEIQGPLMGGQNYAYNFHYAVFNREHLTDLFLKAGFTKVREWDPKVATYYTFNDWATKLAYGKYPIALNLEAVK